MGLKVVLLIKLQKYCTYKRLSIKNLVLLVPVTNVPCNCNGILVTGTFSTKGGQLSLKRKNSPTYITFTNEFHSDPDIIAL